MIALLASTLGHAAPRHPSGAELERALERFATVGNVLYVAAHPDDENTRLLAWLVASAKVRAAYLSLTRGEGGQNLIGSEQAPLLGLIRTHELLQARAIDGAEQLFGSERDFGYSKTPEETLTVWTKEAALGDVVYAIRKFRPDVIVTRFSPEQRDTHGHHTASAMLALEAFTAAADPKQFPEQINATIQPWQAKRIVWNKGFFFLPGGVPKPEDVEGLLRLDAGSFDPLLGASTGEVAGRSRSMHKSQGFGVASQRGSAPEYFRLLAGEPMQKSFLDGIDLTWKRVPGGDKLMPQIDKVRAQFRSADPAASVPALLDLLTAVDALPDSAWKRDKRAALVDLIVGCSGVFLDAQATDPLVSPGETLHLTVSAVGRSAVPLRLHALRVAGKEIAVDKAIERDTTLTINEKIALDGKTPLSTPYWLAAPMEGGRWPIPDPAARALPEQPHPARVEIELAAGAHTLTVARAVDYAWVDPVAGERRRPVEIVPRVTLAPTTPLVVFPSAESKSLKVVVRAMAPNQKGVLKATAPAGFTVAPTAGHKFELKAADSETELEFTIHPPTKLAGETAAALGTLTFVATLEGGAQADSTVTRLDYPHLPTLTVAQPAEVKLSRFEMKRTRSRIGYIPGAGDEVPAALRQAGYTVTVLDDAALAQPLAKYEAIVVGVRAYNVNKKLAALHKKLMDYVQGGGTLIAQYSTNNRLAKLDTPIGPHPFTISQERVTEENAAIERLVDHPAFRTPNAIGPADFEGWVQERGLYFASPYDAKYQALLSMHDANEPAKKGGLLVTTHGKGTFVYTGLAFFRQLPAGVPGAFRLFTNLLHLSATAAKKNGK